MMSLAVDYEDVIHHRAEEDFYEKLSLIYIQGNKNYNSH